MLNVRHDYGRQTATEKKVATATEYCPKTDKRDGKAWQSKHGMTEQAYRSRAGMPGTAKLMPGRWEILQI